SANAFTSAADKVISPDSGLLLIRRVAGTAFFARFIVSSKPTFLKMQKYSVNGMITAFCGVLIMQIGYVRVSTNDQNT
ncbi:hypothetical protein U9K74_24535, partial [Salmonella enterica subsp. enterica serovar Typhimurium]|uniref:hypothetical protein n=1 Tax=Salmonella enterica TaxID=28901 RepID=UPI002AFF0120